MTVFLFQLRRIDFTRLFSIAFIFQLIGCRNSTDSGEVQGGFSKHLCTGKKKNAMNMKDKHLLLKCFELSLSPRINLKSKCKEINLKSYTVLYNLFHVSVCPPYTRTHTHKHVFSMNPQSG